MFVLWGGVGGSCGILVVVQLLPLGAFTSCRFSKARGESRGRCLGRTEGREFEFGLFAWVNLGAVPNKNNN